MNRFQSLDLSAPAYARFLQDQLRGLQGRSTLLKQGDFQLMHTPVGGYAFGWVVLTDPTLGAVSAHNGHGRHLLDDNPPAPRAKPRNRRDVQLRKRWFRWPDRRIRQCAVGDRRQVVPRGG